jgi:hypothetical protein
MTAKFHLHSICDQGHEQISLRSERFVPHCSINATAGEGKRI